MRRVSVLVVLMGLLVCLVGCFLTPPPIDSTLFSEQLFNGATIPGWWTGTDDGKEAWHADSVYHVGISKSQKTFWTTYSVPGRIGDFQLDVDVRQIGGPDDNGFGVVFRKYCYNNYYYFLISGDGYMVFRRVVDGQVTDIQGWTPCPAVLQGNATNHITVVADGTHFAFSVNGTEVLQATDAALATGYFGVMVKSFAESGVHVTFDNVVVHWLGAPPEDMELVTDSFSQGSEHWNATEDGDERTWFENGEYHMLVKTGGIGAALEQYQGTPSEFTNFSLIFDVRVVQGSAENPFGVLFRIGSIGGNTAYYRLLMLGDGQVRLEKRLSGVTTELTDWIDCPWVVAGASRNVQLNADCKRIVVHVDNRLAIDVTDSSLDAGGFGLVAFGLEGPPDFHVAFDNVSLFYYPGD